MLNILNFEELCIYVNHGMIIHIMMSQKIIVQSSRQIDSHVIIYHIIAHLQFFESPIYERGMPFSKYALSKGQGLEDRNGQILLI